MAAPPLPGPVATNRHAGRPGRRQRHGRPPLRRGRASSGGSPTRTASSWSARSAAGPTTGCTCRRCSTASTARRPRARRRSGSTTTTGVELVLGDAVADARLPTPHGRHRRRVARSTFDSCVLATGSAPFVPPIAGTDAAGVLRLPHHRRPRRHPRLGRRVPHRRRRRRRAARARGGQRAAPARPRDHRRRVRPATHGGAARRRRRPGPAAATSSDARHRPCTPVRRRRGADHARRPCRGLELRRGRPDLDADLVVFAAGIRPREQLGTLAPASRSASAAASSSTTAAPPPRPGCSPSARCACHRRSGLRPRRSGYAMAEVGRRRISPAATRTFTGADLSTKLKLLGVDVASVGRPARRGRRRRRRRPVAGHVAEGRRRRRRPGARRGAGRRRRRRSPASPPAPGRASRPRICSSCCDPSRARAGSADLADDVGVCSCHNVTCGTIRAAVDRRLRDGRRRQGVHQGRHRLRLVRARSLAGAHRRRSWRRRASRRQAALRRTSR